MGYYKRCLCGALTLRVLGLFRRPTHLFDSEVHVFPSCKKYHHCTYCTVSRYNINHVSFMASCGHHCHLHQSTTDQKLAGLVYMQTSHVVILRSTPARDNFKLCVTCKVGHLSALCQFSKLVTN